MDLVTLESFFQSVDVDGNRIDARIKSDDLCEALNNAIEDDEDTEEVKSMIATADVFFTKHGIDSREYSMTMDKKFRSLQSPDEYRSHGQIISTDGRYVIIWFSLRLANGRLYIPDGSKHGVYTIFIDTEEKESCEGDIFEDFGATLDTTSENPNHHECQMTPLSNGLVYVESKFEHYIFDPKTQKVVQDLSNEIKEFFGESDRLYLNLRGNLYIVGENRTALYNNNKLEEVHINLPQVGYATVWHPKWLKKLITSRI